MIRTSLRTSGEILLVYQPAVLPTVERSRLMDRFGGPSSGLFRKSEKKGLSRESPGERDTFRGERGIGSRGTNQDPARKLRSGDLLPGGGGQIDGLYLPDFESPFPTR